MYDVVSPLLGTIYPEVTYVMNQIHISPL